MLVGGVDRSVGIPNPVSTVGIPRPTSTATTGSVPPIRTGTGVHPVARAMPSAAAASTGSVGSSAAGLATPRSSIVSSAPGGAAARSRPSSTPASASASCPGASRRDSIAEASDGTIVFTANGSPQIRPWRSRDGEASVRM